MPFQRVPDTAVAEIVMGTSGASNWGPAQSNMYFRFASGYNQANLQTLADAVATWWFERIMDFVSADVQLNEVHVRGLNDDPDVEAFATEHIGDAGLVSANALPGNVAACIRFSTGQVGRSTRGRIFLAGMGDSQTNDDDIVDATKTGLIAAFVALPAYLSAGITHVVVSRVHNEVERDPAVTYLVTDYGFSSGQVATQQRRLHRYG